MPRKKKNSVPISSQLKGWRGENPFLRTKAKNYPNSLVAKEFFPTTNFWDLLTSNNQVIIGSRGTGKTMLVRMLCPSVYKMRKDVAKKILRKRYLHVGFWIPFELRWLSQIDGSSESESNQIFEFMFNCKAFSSLVNEICNLIEIVVGHDVKLTATLKYQVLKYASEILGWDQFIPNSYAHFSSKFDILFLRSKATKFRINHGIEVMQAGLLEPCEVLTKFFSDLISSYYKKRIVWMAAFDEGEYLSENQTKLINTLMRSEREGISVKLTTLPCHHSTRETLLKNVTVDPGGDDYSYVHIDFQSASPEYLSLCDKIISRRLRSLSIFHYIPADRITLRSFFGKNYNKTLTELYYHYFETNKIEFEKYVIELTKKRSVKINYTPHDKNVNRYIPVVAYKKLKKLFESGRSQGVVDSGAERVKKITDGNIREFLRVMAHLFKAAQRYTLTQKRQHVTIQKFAEQRETEALGIEDIGLDLFNLLQFLDDCCKSTFYETELAESGSIVKINELKNSYDEIYEIVKKGVSNCYFKLTQNFSEREIDSNAEFEISSLMCAHYEVYPRRNKLVVSNRRKNSGIKEQTLPLFSFVNTSEEEIEESE